MKINDFRMKAKQILLIICLFLGYSFSANAAKGSTLFASGLPTKIVNKQNMMTLEIQINGNTLLMEGVPTTGYLEVYSILGTKIKSVNLKECFAGDNFGSYTLDLGKGVYILKAGKVSRKVLVR